MKISEQQILQLMYYCHSYSSNDVILSKIGRETVRKLLANIANQQSEELKEVE